MIKLISSEPKRLKFNVSIDGIRPEDLSAFIRFMVNGVELGFKGVIENNIIRVEIPPLDEIVGKHLLGDVTTKGRLDVYGAGYYLSPWEDNIFIKKSIKIEATIQSEDDMPHEEMHSSQPMVQCMDVEEENDLDENVSANIAGFESPTPPISKRTTMDDIDYDTNDFLVDKKLKEQEEEEEKIHNFVLQRVKAKLQKMELKEKKSDSPPPKKKAKKIIKESKSSSLKSSIKPSPKKTIKKKKSIKETKNKKPIKPKTVINENEVKTKEDIIKYMESKGVQNKKFQNMLLERAEMMSEGADISSLFDTIKKMLDVNSVQ
ncbi:MAG: hypothetical protein KatS3mg002_0304 [Candidatus Woesearchaeota archaeon]|nr:MAG: hypothetical protein KatS3mg002_0304 [Candidatus Woesearchaeota archaeon]